RLSTLLQCRRLSIAERGRALLNAVRPQLLSPEDYFFADPRLIQRKMIRLLLDDGPIDQIILTIAHHTFLARQDSNTAWNDNHDLTFELTLPPKKRLQYREFAACLNVWEQEDPQLIIERRQEAYRKRVEFMQRSK